MSISTHVYFIEMRPPRHVVQSSSVKNIVQHLHIIHYVFLININVVHGVIVVDIYKSNLVLLPWIYTEPH